MSAETFFATPGKILYQAKPFRLFVIGELPVRPAVHNHEKQTVVNHHWVAAAEYHYDARSDDLAQEDIGEWTAEYLGSLQTDTSKLSPLLKKHIKRLKENKGEIVKMISIELYTRKLEVIG